MSYSRDAHTSSRGSDFSRWSGTTRVPYKGGLRWPACGHTVRFSGEEERLRLSAFVGAHGQDTCPICMGGTVAAEFRQLEVRYTDTIGANCDVRVTSRIHGFNFAAKLFREGRTAEAQLFENGLSTGNPWRAE